MEFSALLRQPREVPREQKIADVDYIINLLELDDLQDAIIGVPGAGLGVERRKRVTIAVELAAKPDLLLFLDEPTSGQCFFFFVHKDISRLTFIIFRSRFCWGRIHHPTPS